MTEIMTEIKHIRVWSLAKISAVISLFVGLLFVIFSGILIVASSMMGTPMLGTSVVQAGSFTLGAVVAIIAVTGYAIIGFIWGAIAAFIYNIAADWFGGIEIDIE